MSTAPDYGYRIDQIEIDVAASSIRREGANHSLRHQTFQVLLFLLEHTGNPVSKEDLITAIWRDAAVTDNALTQCIAEIRRALGDDSRNPTYIRTVSKVGYQFIAPVEITQIHDAIEPVFVVNAESDASAPLPPERPKLSLLAKPTRPKPEMARPGNGESRLSGRDQLKLGLLLAAVLACTWAIPHLYTRIVNHNSGAASLKSAPSLAILYFKNESGDPNDNWLCRGLSDMLITDMSQVDGLHVVDHAELATLTKKQDQSRSSDPSRSIAQAARASSYLTGSFASTPGQFRIDIQLHNTHSGQIIYAEHSVTASSANVLSQVDVLSAHLAHAMSLKRQSRSGLAAINPEEYSCPSPETKDSSQNEGAQTPTLPPLLS